MKVVRFKYKNGKVVNLNEAAADILEKRGDGKIVGVAKSIIVEDKPENKKDKK